MRGEAAPHLFGMPWRPVICSLLIATALAFAAQAHAQQRRQLDATPFSHAPCSVLDGQPCTPSFCSVFNEGPCIPEIDYPYGQNLQLTVQSVPPQQDAAKYKKPDHDLGNIGDLFAALRACWSPPPADNAREGMQMSVRFSFKRSGEIIAKPQLTFATSGVPGGDARDLSQCDQRLAQCVHAAEIHRWARRGDCGPADRDPLCRQPRFGQVVAEPGDRAAA